MQDRVKHDFPGLATDANLLPLRPLTYLLRNTTGRDVIAYSIRFHVKPLHGSDEVVYMVAERSPRLVDMINGDLPELPAASERLVTPWFRWSLSKWASHPETASYATFSRFRITQEAQSAKQVEVSLDAVIYEDGTLVGTDTGHLGEQFACKRTGEQQEAAEAAALLTGNAPQQEIEGKLQSDIAAAKAASGATDAAGLLAAGRGVLADQVLELLPNRPRPALAMTLQKVAYAPPPKLTRVVHPRDRSDAGGSSPVSANPANPS